MSYLELCKYLSKQWANVNDIKAIGSCGKDTASKIRDNIISQIKDNGLNLPNSKEKIVPMSYVIKYLNLDIDYIYNMALKEKALTN